MRRALKTFIFGLAALLLAPSSVWAANLHFSAPPATVCQGSTFTLDLLLDSPAEGINAGQIDLTFDNTVLQVDSMNWLSSLFRFFPEGPEWDNSAGTIHMSAGLPTPGFQGTNGLIAEITMTANGLGDPALQYEAGTTDILLDDGFGTSTTVTIDNAVFSVLPSTDPACTAPVTCLNQFIFEGGTASLTAAGGDGSYVWTTVGGAPSSGTGSPLGVSYATAGTYPVSVIDEGGKVGNCSVNVTVPPPPAFGCSPSTRSINPGGTATFSAVGGTGPFDWTTTGGTPVSDTGDSFSATYADLGTYVVTMTDSLGASDTCSVRVALPGPIPLPLVCEVPTEDGTAEVVPCTIIESCFGQPDKIIENFISADAVDTSCPILTACIAPSVEGTEDETRDVLQSVLSDDVAEVIVRAAYDNTDIIGAVRNWSLLAAAIAVGIAIAELLGLAGSAVQVAAMLLRGLMGIFTPRKNAQQRLYGRVYDAATKLPVVAARVELLDKENRILETRFTDRDGRYGFVFSGGSEKETEREIQIRVSKEGYKFPAGESDSDEQLMYQHIYHGGLVVVDEKELISRDIPMEPLMPPSFEPRKSPFGGKLIRAFVRLADAAFLVGSVIAPIVFIVQPTLVNGAIVALYGLIALLRVIGARFRPYGLILDAMTSASVPYALITVTDQAGKRVEQGVSDERGRYFILLPKGSFQLNVSTAAQVLPHRQYRQIIRVKKGWMNPTIRL